MKKLYGVVTAMVTPFDRNEHVMTESIRKHVDFLIERGIHCLYPLGTTGEMMLMDTEDRKRVAETVVDQCSQRIPVFIHVGAMRTKDTCELARHASEIGADGIGAVTPAFYSATSDSIYDYYAAVAKSVPEDFPVYLYNIPQCSSVAGEYSRYGVELAVEEINNAGGFEVGGKMYTIEIVEEDNEGKPEITNNAYNKLIGQDEVKAIIGPDASGPLISAGPLATAAKIPAIGTTASNPDCTTVGGEYVFRACWIDSFQAVVCARMASEILGATKVAVLYSNADDYSSGLATNFQKEFEALGGEIVAFEAYAGADTKDFKAQLTNIQNSGAEVIFLPNQAGELPLQIQQIREMGIDAEIMGEMSWDNPNVPELAGNENVEGCYFISLFAADSTDPVSQAFTEAFREKYGFDPNTQSTMSYDSVQILVDAFKRAGTVDDSEALRDAIQATDMDLPSGHLVFDENRNPQKSANVMVYKDGVPTYVSTIDP